ncbi:MAG: PLDc N-terminal domain-containing protein [Bacteroidota bacterium]
MPVILLSILWLAAIIYTIKGIFERNDMERNTQLLWTILIVVAPIFGLVIYYVFGDVRRN